MVSEIFLFKNSVKHEVLMTCVGVSLFVFKFFHWSVLKTENFDDKKQNLHYTRGITPKRVTNCGPWRHCIRSVRPGKRTQDLAHHSRYLYQLPVCQLTGLLPRREKRCKFEVSGQMR